MELSDRQKRLLAFVKEQHGDQMRKYTAEPYWHHVVKVAEIANKRVEGAVEIAFCHDLLEDTKCNYDALYAFLQSIEYSKEESREICKVVKELTDVFIKEDFPHLNRRKRKINEAKRLGSISELGQSVKYADLIDNTSSIIENDYQFSKVYLKEAIDILDKMRKGNIFLLIDCCYAIKQSMDQISKR